MAAADTARLIASLELKDKFSPGLTKAGRALGTFDAKLDRSESRAFRAGQQIGTGIKNTAKIAAVGVGVLASQVALGLQSLIKLEEAQAQTAAVIKSTGAAAGITAAQVGTLAEKYEALNATVGDETIRETENLLLTFTNIKRKAFEPALEAILDMNTAMGKGPEGLTTTAIQVGKALNDPAKGFTALRRVGVTFTKDQEKRIKALQKEGKLYEAQQIILKELSKEFGGSFLAQGDTTAGKVAKFTDSIEDLQRSLATALLPAIGNVADELSRFLQDPAVIRGAETLGVEIGKLFSKQNISEGIELLRGGFRAAKEAGPIIAAAAQTMGKVLSTAVSVFKSLPPELQSLAVGGLAVNKLTGGLVTNIAGGLISSVLKQLVSGVVNVNGATVIVNGAGVPAAGAGAAGAAAGVGAGLAAGAIGAAVGATIVSTLPFALKNIDLGDKGLNSAEIAAVKYYQSSIAEQRRAATALGYIPSRSDFDAGIAKLNAASGAVGNSVSRAGATNVAAAREVALQAQRAGERARGGGLAAAFAIRDKDLSVNVRTNVNINARLSARDAKTRLTFQQKVAEFG